MKDEHTIIKDVYAAKTDTDRADELIRRYLPFIKAEASRQTGRVCTEQDDEYSIAMMAFYEAILGYEKERGAFKGYASMLIRSRIIDYHRKETRHEGHASLYEERGDGDRTLADELCDDRDHIGERLGLEATQQEIEELSKVLYRAGVTFSDVADNCPRQERTMAACHAVLNCARANPMLLDRLVHTGRLPVRELAMGSGVDKKTIERHRKYLVAILLAFTNGYEIIRGHLRQIAPKGGERT